jgi:membrane protein
MIVMRPHVLRRGWTMVQTVLDRPHLRAARTAYRRYYGTGTHRTASAAAYYGVLTMLPFLGLFYVLLAQLAHAVPNFLRSSRRALQATLGLSPGVVANLYSAQGTASLRSVLTLLGVVGLVYAGVNWMDAVEQGLWSVWPRATGRTWWRRYLRRWATLLVTLPGLLLIVLVAVFVGRSPYRLLIDDGLHFARSTILLSEVAALIATVVLAGLLCYAAYRRVGTAPPDRSVRLAALLAGVAVGGLAAIGAFALPVVLSNPYGIVVVILALMLWVSASVRAMLAMAVWARTRDDGHRANAQVAPARLTST